MNSVKVEDVLRVLQDATEENNEPCDASALVGELEQNQPANPLGSLRAKDEEDIKDRSQSYTAYIWAYTRNYMKKADLTVTQKKWFFGLSLGTAGAIIIAGAIAVVALAFRKM